MLKIDTFKNQAYCQDYFFCLNQNLLYALLVIMNAAFLAIIVNIRNLYYVNFLTVTNE
jgi:hypothetical protein